MDSLYLWKAFIFVLTITNELRKILGSWAIEPHMNGPRIMQDTLSYKTFQKSWWWEKIFYSYLEDSLRTLSDPEFRFMCWVSTSKFIYLLTTYLTIYLPVYIRMRNVLEGIVQANEKNMKSIIGNAKQCKDVICLMLKGMESMPGKGHYSGKPG